MEHNHLVGKRCLYEGEEWGMIVRAYDYEGELLYDIKFDGITDYGFCALSCILEEDYKVLNLCDLDLAGDIMGEDREAMEEMAYEMGYSVY